MGLVELLLIVLVIPRHRGRDRREPAALAAAAGSPRRLPHGRRVRISQRREGLGMTLGTSIFLIAVGAIIRYGLTFHVSGVSRPTIGLILMIAGVVGRGSVAVLHGHRATASSRADLTKNGASSVVVVTPLRAASAGESDRPSCHLSAVGRLAAVSTQSSQRRSPQQPKPGGTMTDKNIDQAKGRVKEAAGALTGDRGLKNEGHADQAKASLKKAVDRVAEAVKGRQGDSERG